MILLYAVATLCFFVLFGRSDKPKPYLLFEAVSTKLGKFTGYFLVFLLAQVDLYLGSLLGISFYLLDKELQAVDE